MPITTRIFELLVHLLDEMTTVAESGERIVVGKVAQLRLHLALFWISPLRSRISWLFSARVRNSLTMPSKSATALVR